MCKKFQLPFLNQDWFDIMCFSGEHKDINLAQTAESSKAMENYCAICMFKVRNTWNLNTYFLFWNKYQIVLSNNIFQYKKALNKDEFDEHILKPEHNEKVKKSDSSKDIDNFLSAMRGYVMISSVQWLCIYSIIRIVI